MIGQPFSEAQFRAINAVGAAVIGVAAVVPLLCVRVRPLWRVLPVLGWVGAVGCCMHAVVDSVLRLLSITGVHPTQLPADFWLTFDRHTADLQDLLLNEPWFLVEGLLWGALGLALVGTSRRRAWLISAIVTCLAATIRVRMSGSSRTGRPCHSSGCAPCGFRAQDARRSQPDTALRPQALPVPSPPDGIELTHTPGGR